MPNREQTRAEIAFKKITEVAEWQKEAFQKKYGGVCLKMPAMIQQSGLCQAVAFYQAKAADTSNAPDSNERKLYLGHFAEAVLGERATRDQLGEQTRSCSMGEYQRLTREATQCAIWFKRYAEAVLRVQPGEDMEER